jgi:glutamate synthase (NADPH) large chain
MGNDTPLGCLSDRPRLVYDYFKQHFAQVGPRHAHRIHLPLPILTDHEMAGLSGIKHRGWRARILDLTIHRETGPAGLEPALDALCAAAYGIRLIVLSEVGARITAADDHDTHRAAKDGRCRGSLARVCGG